MSLKEDQIVIDPTNGLTVSLESGDDGKTISVSFSFPEDSEVTPSVDVRHPMIQIIRARLQNNDMSTTSHFDSVEDKTHITYNGNKPHSLNFMLGRAKDAIKAVAYRTQQGASLDEAMDAVLSFEQAMMPAEDKLINRTPIAEAIRKSLRNIVSTHDGILLAERISVKLAAEYPVWPKTEQWQCLRGIFNEIREPLSAFITDEVKLKKVTAAVMSAIENSYTRASAVGRV